MTCEFCGWPSGECDCAPPPDAPEHSGWYCPDCEAETRHILCDGCKSLICEVCGYPCECGDREADYAEAKAENDSAADLGPEA